VKSAEARDEALSALYEADQRRQEPDAGDIGRRAAEMVAGVWAERESLDAAIGATATGWRVERMPPIDRNVLRIALWELRYRPGTPVAVVISEAVRLAKTYSTARSGGFINGVLARLAGERPPAGD
jgi:transcription antitermination protein NusB